MELMIALEQGSSLGFKWVLGEPVIQLPLLLGDGGASEEDGTHFELENSGMLMDLESITVFC